MTNTKESPFIHFPSRTIALSKEELNRRKANAPLKAEKRALLHRMLKRPSKVNIHLMLTNKCNMSCSYCFAYDGSYGKSIQEMDASAATGIAALSESFLKNGISVNILHFGGEPLLNFKVMKQVIDCTHGLDENYSAALQHSIVTNGTVLNTEIVQIIIKNKVSVVLSFDGRKSVHDKVRKYKNGTGTYDAVLKGLSLLPKGYPILIRSTISYWTDIAKELEFFKSLNVKGIEFGYLGEYPEKENTTYKLKSQLDSYFRYSIEKNDPSYIRDVEPFRTWLMAIHKFAYEDEYSRLRDCGAGSRRLTITPDGSIIPCHIFFVRDDWRNTIIGHISSGIDEQKRKEFLEQSYNFKENCESCYSRLCCSGPCIHYETDGEDLKPTCFVDVRKNDVVKCMTQDVFVHWYCILRDQNPVLLYKITK